MNVKVIFKKDVTLFFFKTRHSLLKKAVQGYEKLNPCCLDTFVITVIGAIIDYLPTITGVTSFLRNPE